MATDDNRWGLAEFVRRRIARRRGTEGPAKLDYALPTLGDAPGQPRDHLEWQRRLGCWGLIAAYLVVAALIWCIAMALMWFDRRW
jgi:hypothetical protein